MARHLTACAAFIAGLTAPAFTQPAANRAAFEVASVRRVPPGLQRSRDVVVQPGRLTAEGVTVRELVSLAYGLLDHQIDGGASRIAADRYEIRATMKSGAQNDELREMLRGMLAARFGLAARMETRERPAYRLRVRDASGVPGSGIRRSGPECAPMSAPPPAAKLPAFVPAPPPPPDGARLLHAVDDPPGRCISMAVRFNGVGHWSLREVTMGAFATRLTRELERPVLDETKLAGSYDLDLTFTSDAAALVATAPGVPVLPTALREQLGLQIDSTRADVDVLVIDRVEPPTEN